MADHRRKFAKYPDCFGKLSLHELVAVARRNGMQCITGYKPCLHVFGEIGLYGTRTQMKKTEQEWLAQGHKMKPRSFHAVFGVELDCSPEFWVERQLEKEELAKKE